MKLPPIVAPAEWQKAHDRLLLKEKEATHARDALAAERRRLPRVLIDKDYEFDGPAGKASLLDLFRGRRQLVLYHFMFAPGVEGWPAAGCGGCTMFVDNLGNLVQLGERDTSFALVSRAPLANIEAYKERKGWTAPWFSSAGSTFNCDFGVTTDEGETFGLSVFIRDGDGIFRTYFTAGRGVEMLGTSRSFLDLTPLGRQEAWEDSPAGYPACTPTKLFKPLSDCEINGHRHESRRPVVEPDCTKDLVSEKRFSAVASDRWALVQLRQRSPSHDQPKQGA